MESDSQKGFTAVHYVQVDANLSGSGSANGMLVVPKYLKVLAGLIRFLLCMAVAARPNR